MNKRAKEHKRIRESVCEKDRVGQERQREDREEEKEQEGEKEGIPRRPTDGIPRLADASESIVQVMIYKRRRLRQCLCVCTYSDELGPSMCMEMTEHARCEEFVEGSCLKCLDLSLL